MTIDTERESRHEKEAAHREQMVSLLEALDGKQIAEAALSVKATVPVGNGAGTGGACALEFEAHVRRLLTVYRHERGGRAGLHPNECRVHAIP